MKVKPVKQSHSLDESAHLENLVVEQTRSKHSDAVGVNHCVVAAGQRTGHLLLAVQQQGHIFLGNGQRDAMPPEGIQSTF